MGFELEIRHLQKRGNREQGTGNPPLAPPPPRRGVIDNFWIRIDFIFDFWRCLLASVASSTSENEVWVWDGVFNEVRS
ncbi:MAG: hypothetical protein F6K18_27700 [Okeania sp. SIO2C2]|uniref:hypothetical protein n=1 Tax=Okeania sp. SIO2C2 TaxID=2607787 RepID=UPI0013B5FD6A|nr:hypothetical protein [Okeania sp. SIO2C2]NEP90308.1 hypothetical protein [Okeania sp. SIO2C2]